VKSALAALLLSISLLPAKCMSIFNPYPRPGATEQEVVARMGAPAHRYHDGDASLLEFPGGEFGQETFMARMGPDGRLAVFEQVRTAEKFASLHLNQSDKDDVLKTVGTPSETAWLALAQREVWSYRYKESGVWNSMMHIHFDRDGVVRKIESGRDPLFEG
jgi:hypothetical protein